MFLAMSWYAIDGRKWFKGPRINVHVTHEGQEVFDGHSGDSGSDHKRKELEAESEGIKLE